MQRWEVVVYYVDHRDGTWYCSVWSYKSFDDAVRHGWLGGSSPSPFTGGWADSHYVVRIIQTENPMETING